MQSIVNCLKLFLRVFKLTHASSLIEVNYEKWHFFLLYSLLISGTGCK